LLWLWLEALWAKVLWLDYWLSAWLLWGVLNSWETVAKGLLWHLELLLWHKTTTLLLWHLELLLWHETTALLLLWHE